MFLAALLLRQNLQEIDDAILLDIPEIIIEDRDVPDFSAILNIPQKKQTFFNYLLPYIDAVNQKILYQRQELRNLSEKLAAGRTLSRSETNFVTALKVEYKLDNEMLNTQNLINRLLRRVDIIPSSLALAQAANESAWGASRFAQQGNNFFGQWCYSRGCGMVPRRRPEAASHEVRRFDSAFESVEAYIMNLNTFSSYSRLRLIREELRKSGQAINGIVLSEGLESYSERGGEYIIELQSMIQSNGLLEFDTAGV